MLFSTGNLIIIVHTSSFILFIQVNCTTIYFNGWFYLSKQPIFLSLMNLRFVEVDGGLWGVNCMTYATVCVASCKSSSFSFMRLSPFAILLVCHFHFIHRNGIVDTSKQPFSFLNSSNRSLNELFHFSRTSVNKFLRSSVIFSVNFSLKIIVRRNLLNPQI